MPGPRPASAETTYPLRAASRLTGVSPELLRAWERRYGVVRPRRTPGGTRRYSAADLERLRLVKAAVDAGHRIGQVAHLGDAELERLSRPDDRSGNSFDAILAALDRLEAAEFQRLLALQLAALGPLRFAREVAAPLVREIGDRWGAGQLGVASEHAATAVLRSLLGSAFQPTPASTRGPRIVFATPSGERHELGLLMAALTALGAGANPLYLGADLPVEDTVAAVRRTDASVLAISIATPAAPHARSLRALRDSLAGTVRLWVGGRGSQDLALPSGVERIGSLEDLEQRIALLDFE